MGDGFDCSGFRDSESIAVLTAKDHYLRVIIHLAPGRPLYCPESINDIVTCRKMKVSHAYSANLSLGSMHLERLLLPPIVQADYPHDKDRQSGSQAASEASGFCLRDVVIARQSNASLILSS